MMQYFCYTQLNIHTCIHSRANTHVQKNGNSSIDFNFIFNSHESVSSAFVCRAVLCSAVLCFVFIFMCIRCYINSLVINNKQVPKVAKQTKNAKIKDKLHTKALVYRSARKNNTKTYVKNKQYRNLISIAWKALCVVVVSSWKVYCGCHGRILLYLGCEV